MKLLSLAALAVALHAQPLPSEAHQQEQIRKYEQLVADNPRDVEFWHDLGDLYRQSELWDKAIHAYTEAITRHPKYAAAFYGRAKARVSKEQYAESVADFNECIRLLELRGGLEVYLTDEQPSPIYIDSYRTRGVALSHLGRYNEAIADVAIALRLRKDDPTLLYEKGYLEEKAGHKNDAIADYRRSGLVYADAHSRKPAEDCAVRLEALGAKAEADAIRRQLEPKKQKSDLP